MRANVVDVAVGPVPAVDGVGLELVKPQVAQHEIGHRLVQVAEEQHLAHQVGFAAVDPQQAIARAQALEAGRVAAGEQRRLDFRAPLPGQRAVAGGVDQLGAGEQGEQVGGIDLGVGVEQRGGVELGDRRVQRGDLRVTELAGAEPVAAPVQQPDAQLARVIAERVEALEKLGLPRLEDIAIGLGDVREQRQHVVEVVIDGQVGRHRGIVFYPKIQRCCIQRCCILCSHPWNR